jgi:DNA-binding transcriptional ArsR family regulator/uncharacterized protein YndB with AHSA1/START domain
MSHMETAELDPVWRALSNPVRRRVLDLLRERARTTGEVAAAFPALSRFAVMQHLGVLEAAGLVLVRREGTRRFNTLNPVPLRQIYERWVSARAGLEAASALELKRYVERAEGGGRAMEMAAGKLEKIEMEVRLAARPERVFAALTVEMDRWWPFRFRPEGKLVVEPHVGGRCWEDWGEGQGALHGFITYYEPPVKLGNCGIGAMADSYASTRWVTIEPEGEGSVCRMSLTLWGAVPEEAVTMYREGNRAIFERHLREYLEHGKEFERQP